jgi:hypothetical protein
MKGRPVLFQVSKNVLIELNDGRAYDLLQSLCGTETSRARADDEDIDIAAERN